MKSPSPTPTVSSTCTSSSSPVVKYLPDEFAPSPNEVIVGRGKKIATHPGNQRLKSLVRDRLDEYEHANDKTHKTYIISQIFHEIRRSSACGGFVKRDTLSGRWYSVRDPTARTNIAQSFRDALHELYRSSKASKQRKRLDSLQRTNGDHNYGMMPEGSNNSHMLTSMPPRFANHTMGGAAPNMGGAGPLFVGGPRSLQEETIQMMVRYNFDQSLLQQGAQLPNPMGAVPFQNHRSAFCTPNMPGLPATMAAPNSAAWGFNSGVRGANSITDILSNALEMTERANEELGGHDVSQQQQQQEEQVDDSLSCDDFLGFSFVPTDEFDPVDNPFEPVPIREGAW